MFNQKKTYYIGRHTLKRSSQYQSTFLTEMSVTFFKLTMLIFVLFGALLVKTGYYNKNVINVHNSTKLIYMSQLV